MLPLTAKERDSVRRNIFPESAAAALGRDDFPWHRDSAKQPTASLPESSQALAIDLFGVLQALKDSSRIVHKWMSALALPTQGSWRSSLEYLVPRNLLGEPRSTQVDAVLESESCVAFVECKFTEPDGGSCSQTRALRPPSRNAGLVQCDGRYVSQINPVNGAEARCALTGKGVRYWERVPAVLGIRNDHDHDPCPFRDGEYQWMRNLIACDAQSTTSGRSGSFLVVYADGPFPMATKVKAAEWSAFVSRTQGKAVPLRAVSYQHLLDVAVSAATPEDRGVLIRLGNWIDDKVSRVAARVT